VGAGKEWESTMRRVARRARTQGSTFLWVEQHGEPLSRAGAATETATDVVFGVALLVLAHGAAYFIGLQRFY